jgi:hypothetical protein
MSAWWVADRAARQERQRTMAGDVVANTRSWRYYLATDPGYERARGQQNVIFFPDEQSAIVAGYKQIWYKVKAIGETSHVRGPSAKIGMPEPEHMEKPPMTNSSEFIIRKPDSEHASTLALQAIRKAEAGDVASAIRLIEEAIKLDSIAALNRLESRRDVRLRSTPQKNRPISGCCNCIPRGLFA